MHFPFLKGNFFKSKTAIVAVGITAIGGLLLFFPNLLAQYSIFDQDSVQSAKVEQVFENFASGTGYESLQNIAPNLTDALSTAVLQQVIGGLPSLDDGAAIEQRYQAFADSPETQQQIVEQFVAQALTKMPLYFPDINPSTITVKQSETSGADIIITYLRSLETILQSNFSGFEAQNPLEVIEAGISQNDFSHFVDAKARLERTCEALLEIPVPPPLVGFHQKEVVLLTETAAVFDALAAFRADPVKSFLAINRYQQIQELNIQLEEELRSTLAELERIYR